MKNIRNLAIAFVAFGFPAAGFAQDATNWTGFYAGATVSGDSVKTSSKGVGYFFDDIPDDLVALFYDTAPQGAKFGLRAGYNYDLGSGWVAGLEGAANSGKVSDTIYDLNARFDDEFITAKLNKNVELKTRIGYVSGQTLLFAAAGLTSAEYSVELTDPAIDDESAMLQGFVLGAGVEHMLTNKVSLSLEYIHADYGTHTVFENFEDGGYGLDVDVISKSMRVGVNYRF